MENTSSEFSCIRKLVLMHQKYGLRVFMPTLFVFAATMIPEECSRFCSSPKCEEDNTSNKTKQYKQTSSKVNKTKNQSGKQANQQINAQINKQTTKQNKPGDKTMPIVVNNDTNYNRKTCVFRHC